MGKARRQAAASFEERLRASFAYVLQGVEKGGQSARRSAAGMPQIDAEIVAEGDSGAEMRSVYAGLTRDRTRAEFAGMHKNEVSRVHARRAEEVVRASEEDRHPRMPESPSQIPAVASDEMFRSKPFAALPNAAAAVAVSHVLKAVGRPPFGVSKDAVRAMALKELRNIRGRSASLEDAAGRDWPEYRAAAKTLLRSQGATGMRIRGERLRSALARSPLQG